MDFGLSDDQQALRELARKILTELETHDRLKALEASDDPIDRELWAQLAQASLLGVAVAEEHGGSGLGFTELCLLLQEVGRAAAQVPAWPTLVLGALPLQAYGSDAARHEWLPAVARGEAILTAALEESTADAPRALRTRARRDGAGYRLEGEKTCVRAAPAAARILVPARDDDGRVALFFVDPADDGVAVDPQRSTNHESMGRLRLDGAAVTEADRLGAADQGEAVLDWIVQHATAALCALQLGVSERALEITAGYARERRQFDRPIGSFQAVHQRAADAHVDVEAMRLTTWQAVWCLSDERPAADALRVAKYWAATGGQRAGYAAQHLHGGIGVDVDYPIHRYYQWTKQIALTLGGAGAQLARIGASLAE